MEYSEVKKHLYPVLLKNSQQNQGKYLGRDNGDFYMAFSIRPGKLQPWQEKSNFFSSTQHVTWQQFLDWQIPYQNILEAANQNLQKEEFLMMPLNTAIFMSMFEEAETYPDLNTGIVEKSPEGIYVVSNRTFREGADVLLCPKYLERIGEIIGGNYYVVPSSIHEILIVPEKGEIPVNIHDFHDIINTVNQNNVALEEQLGDYLQRYDSEKKLLVSTGTQKVVYPLIQEGKGKTPEKSIHKSPSL